MVDDVDILARQRWESPVQEIESLICLLDFSSSMERLKVGVMPQASLAGLRLPPSDTTMLLRLNRHGGWCRYAVGVSC